MSADLACPRCGHSYDKGGHQIGGVACLERQLTQSRGRIGERDKAVTRYSEAERRAVGEATNLRAMLEEAQEGKRRAERERDRARTLLSDWTARWPHSGACCRLDADGKVVTPDDACACLPLARESRAFLAALLPNPLAPGVTAVHDLAPGTAGPPGAGIEWSTGKIR